MKAKVIVADPPYSFSDKLTMSDVKRGSASNYSTMTVKELEELDVKSIVANDAVLALWVPSSLLVEGISIMKAWGFIPKQTHIWVKTKKEPFKEIIKVIGRFAQGRAGLFNFTSDLAEKFSMSSMLAFGMGHLFRQCHEVCLIGTRGKPYKYLKDKSQRSVHFSPVLKHSAKPEIIQDMLEKMFPRVKKLEIFARRDRKGWECIGDESQSTYGEDIRVSLNALNEK